ncbi:MAG: NAD-dependent epimerase/dehydratase family protein [Selenomonadaceae bacterium]|nr:NAD-dependent epimerase/dehydratase family protein [Selenomonadaceae bacterium]
MKILVTGGAGFIGSHLLPVLLKQGHEVTVADNLTTGFQEYVPDGVRTEVLDVRSEALTELMQQERFEAVVHLAAQTQVDVSMQEPQLDADENVMGTINVLEASRKSGVKRIVIASSAAVYGDTEESDLPLQESLNPKPMSFYGLSKQIGESYLSMYQQAFGLDFVVLRFANVYGERQGNGGEGGVISIFAKAAAKGRDLNIYGDGEQTRDFVYAGDIARGISAALLTGEVNTVYNLATATEISVNSLITNLKELSGKQLTVHYLPSREGDIRRSCLSNAKARQGLGWQPEVDIHEGLRRTYDYFVRQENV